MMQVMMYAYPAYVALPGDLTPEMEQLLRWASWVLTLPVMLFSSGPFFRAALQDLRHRRIGMDMPVAIGIAITFGVSTVGTFEPLGIFGREVYFDSLTMFVFFLLTGRWLELRLRDRTAGALEALMNRMPDSVEREIADGGFETVSSSRLHPGDRVRVYPGQSFPADGFIVAGQTSVDEALLTGESLPMSRLAGNPVLCGSHNLSGTVLVRVESVGASTRFAQIVALMESAASSKPHIAKIADRLATPFLGFILLTSLASCVWWWPHDPGHALMISVAILVVTCPCALSLATPAAMLASAGALAKSGVLVRRLQALETLAKVDVLVFDKTGTLTTDSMALYAVTTREGLSSSIALEMAVALARQSLHPVSRALVAAHSLRDPPMMPDRWQAVDTCEQSGQGLSGKVIFQSPASDATVLRLGSAFFCELPTSENVRPHVYLADSRGWMATFEFEESLRPNVPDVVRMLQRNGVEVRMLSGDSALATAAVAKRAGIEYARGACTPKDKLEALLQLQAKGHIVAMVGDGLNDGPVLAGADVSMAFGKSVPLAQAHADFVMSGNNIALVGRSLLLARRTMRVVRQNLWWALSYNAACIPLAVLGYLPAWLAGLGMAASSLVVVVNAMRLALASSLEKTV